MHRLGPCLTELRILAQSKGVRRDIQIEKNIDEYLRTDPFSLAHALERLRRAIHYEELQRREGEGWSVAKNTFDCCCTGWFSNSSFIVDFVVSHREQFVELWY
jgi:hypothetical protein